jgi:hypothetical protein
MGTGKIWQPQVGLCEFVGDPPVGHRMIHAFAASFLQKTQERL